MPPDHIPPTPPPTPPPTAVGPNLDVWDEATWDTSPEPAVEPAVEGDGAGIEGGTGSTTGRGSGSGGDEAEVQLRYPTVAAWVEQWLSPMIRRPVNVARSGRRFAWCPQWWQHSEAMDRLQATWRAWEAARVSPEAAAIANWWLLVLDPMLDRILDEDGGPFARCFNGGEHRGQYDPLPCTQAPAGWWPAEEAGS